ncbi:transcription antitermination factor NusB [Roseibium polysiphoniae]|uniref:Transcription antitermination protein NusB n=1 Tax=Roseibium polysiphoniae TaxID=2571221 RepID=A0A927K9E4_9HYPH|nr:MULTISPECIES: transcription antitermination factor NusB [Stappiaceae]MBD8875081.1 transcription antitermination factor NusB [Roseibium polysiphoniae]MBS8258976.1 transcription antitermination factor NusB [Roseibium polysiphoniae]
MTDKVEQSKPHTDSKPKDDGPRPANKRGVARLAAVQALYQMDVGGAPLSDVVSEFTAFRLGKELDGEQYRDADEQWFKDIVKGVVADQKFLDPFIHTALSEGWPLKRIDSLLRAILRSGGFELLRRKDVPARVIISEYIDVAKAFFQEDEPGLVNGVLDRLAHDLRNSEFVAPDVQPDEAGTGEA